MSQFTCSVPVTAPLRCTQGFALLEALIAFLVISIGFIGAARMQTIGLGFSNSAAFRQQANVLANQMAERIRSNTSGAMAGGYNDLTAASLENATQCAVSSTGCTSATQMAIEDFAAWQTDITQAHLPNAVGVVCRAKSEDLANESDSHDPPCNSTGDVLAIKLSWSEKNNPTTRFVLAIRPW